MPAGRRDDWQMRDYIDRTARQVGDDIRAQIAQMHDVGVKAMADYETRLRKLELEYASRTAVRRAIWAAICSPIVAVALAALLTYVMR